MNTDDLERIWKEAVLAYSRYCPELARGTDVNHENVNQDSQCTDRNSKGRAAE
jgi:hypothetical protein